jgi:hypothetical protein
MGTRGVSIFAAVLAVAAILSGCGGGGDSSSDGGSISKAAFVKQAEAVCKSNTRRLQRDIIRVLRTKHGIRKPSPKENVYLVGAVIVPNVRREVKELRALSVPSEDKDTIDAMIGALEDGLETAEKDPKAVTSTSDVVFGIASRLAAEYGLEACGTR